MDQPLLSANLYCAGGLDRLMVRILPRLLQWSAAAAAGEESFIWLIRYRRGGEHLKIRWHGPERIREAARRELESTAAELFAALPAADPELDRSASGDLPPIDREDARAEPYPDRSLLFTDYLASPITVGAPVFAADGNYLLHFSRALGAAAAVLAAELPGIPAAADGRLPVAARQRLVFKLAIAATAGFGLAGEERLRYLRYHRDWLVRWLMLKVDPLKMDEAGFLAVLDGSLAKNQGLVRSLSGILQSEDRAAAAEQDAAEQTAAEQAAAEQAAGSYPELRRALAGLADYTRRFGEDEAYDLDPYADSRSWLPLFKALHGIANQVGLDGRQEAFVYHLLAAAGQDALDGGQATEPAPPPRRDG